MEISELAFRLLILFLPGVLGTYLAKRLTTHSKLEPFHFIIQSFLFGIAAYFLYWLASVSLHKLCAERFDGQVVFFSALQKQNVEIEFQEIAWACLAAVICALGFSYIEKHKLINRGAQWLHVTKKSGELDVWGYTMNIEEVVWVTVRDISNDLLYTGWIQSFSDDASNAELLLRDVSVFRNSNANRLYQTGLLYISLDRDFISIECDTIEIHDTVKWKTKKKRKTKKR